MLRTKRDALAAAVDDGAVVLAVCGGYQLLGHGYQLGDERIEGLGLADLETVREPGPRLIGNVAIEADLGGGPRVIAGLREPRRAHPPRARRRAARPGDQAATATTARDGLEGVRRANLIGTYLHGPLLPKNAWLADRLIALALARRGGSEPSSSRSTTRSSRPRTRARWRPRARGASVPVASVRAKRQEG